MKRIRWLVLFILLATVMLLAKTWQVKVVRADIRAKPDFLSSAVTSVKRGDTVDMLEEGDRGWLLVKVNGQKGYLHQSALAGSKSALSGVRPGEKAATPEEEAAAAKGFNEATERGMRGSRGYNYADLEWVIKQGVDTSKLRKFVEEGKLK